jgi:hypothetical protein
MGRKKASDARRKALEREEKMWRNDKLSFIAAVVTFIIAILHRVFFKPDVMTGEQGLRTVFMFSLLRIILGLAAEVSFGVALGRLMLIQRSETLAYAADTVEAKFSSGKCPPHKHARSNAKEDYNDSPEQHLVHMPSEQIPKILPRSSARDPGGGQLEQL